MGALHLTPSPESKSKGKVRDDHTGGQLTLQRMAGWRERTERRTA